MRDHPLWPPWTKEHKIYESAKRIAQLGKELKEENRIRAILENDQPCPHGKAVSAHAEPLHCAYCGILMRYEDGGGRGLPRVVPFED